VSPTEDRVKALKECKETVDVKSLRSFLCTVLWSSTVHERRMHGLGTTKAAHKKWSPLAVDRDLRLRRDQGAHLSEVHGLLLQRLGNRAHIRRKSSGA
jgi:hypothetical protein